MTRSRPAGCSTTSGCAVASSHTWADLADPEAVARAAGALAELGSPRMIVSRRVRSSTSDAGRRVRRSGSAAAAVAATARPAPRLPQPRHGDAPRSTGRPVIDRLAGPARRRRSTSRSTSSGWSSAAPTRRRSSRGSASGSCRSTSRTASTCRRSAYADEPFVNVPGRRRAWSIRRPPSPRPRPCRRSNGSSSSSTTSRGRPIDAVAAEPRRT